MKISFKIWAVLICVLLQLFHVTCIGHLKPESPLSPKSTLVRVSTTSNSTSRAKIPLRKSIKSHSHANTSFVENIKDESTSTMQSGKEENAKKKQYSTDDFQVDTMTNGPLISQSLPPPSMVPSPNHVQIDYPDESVHLDQPPPEPHIEEPHFEPQNEPHIEPHIEEPVFVHHIEPPPPPPPPEPVMIPVPIQAPPPPPPPPPPCTVHIPVTIHLKGKLAIKMRHCQNCDFSKNIEAIGPLKIASLNDLKHPSIGAAEAQAKKTNLQTPSEVPGTKRNEPPVADIDDVLSNSDDIVMDKDFMDQEKDIRGTKKDMTTEHNRQHVVVTKSMSIPQVLVPTDAFKRGVIISLPKGKALLKCVVPINETASPDSSSILQSSESPVSPVDNQKTKTATYSADDNEVVSLSSPTKVITPQSTSSSTTQMTNTANESNESNFQHHTRRHHSAKAHTFTANFMKMFDKDMLVSLYKMAVTDILNELHQQKRAHRKTQILKNKIKNLQHQRSSLEKQFPGILTSLIEPKVPLVSEFSTKQETPTDKTKVQLKLLAKRKTIEPMPQALQTSSGTRRVKLVDTDRPVVTRKPVNSVAQHVAKAKTQPRDEKEVSGALSFYGDVDPMKLIDGGPTCIDAMCEKDKQFIKHAGQYFQSLNNIALEPYKQFMAGKEKDVSIMDDIPKVYKLPYGETINIQGLQRHDIAKLEGKQSKRESIVNSESDGDLSEPSTIVELFGKLPRVPLKITLNPKGPLAKLKKPIEIDLRPPANGESSTRMIATANDPRVAVHIANKIFKEEPLNPKQEEKLQQIYADIKRRSLSEDNQVKHVTLKPQKILNEQGTSRMKIIVSLPKELSRLVSNNNKKFNMQPQLPSPEKSSILPDKPTYVIGEANEQKLIGKGEANINTLQPKLVEYEKKLKELQEETKAAMVQFNKMKDPYSDIGKKRSKTKKRQKVTHKSKVHEVKKDPYADVGAIAVMKRSETRYNISVKINPTESPAKKHKEVTEDPYATLGSSLTSLNKRAKLPSKRSSNKRGKLSSKKRSHKSKNKKLVKAVNSEKRAMKGMSQTKEDVPSGLGAMSLVRHEPRDITKEVTVEPSAKIQDNSAAKVNADKTQETYSHQPLSDEEKSAMLTSFPHFRDALSKINPETRKKLFQLKPFKFLTNFENANGYNKKMHGRDPYADLGSEVTTNSKKRKLRSKKRSNVKHHNDHKSIATTDASAIKRSDTFDPYADLGTSIGLTQNEARTHDKNEQKLDVANNTQVVKVNLKQNEVSHEELKNYGHSGKMAKLMPPSTRSHDSEFDHESRFVNVAASHIGALDTADPYADLGASANGHTLPQSSNSTAYSEGNVGKLLATNSTTPVEKINKEEHFVNRIRVREKASFKEQTKEMEAGDLNADVVAAESMPNVEKAVAAENDLATIERLEKDIAAEKIKAEAAQFPARSLLQQNVGKEIQGPYADLGGPSTKKKTVEVTPSVRQLPEPIGRSEERKQHRSTFEHSILTKLSTTNLNEATINSVINERNVERIFDKGIKVSHKKTTAGKNCVNVDPEKAMQIMKGTAEKSVNNVTKIDPYLFIGKAVDMASKRGINLCNVPIIKEEEAPSMEEGAMNVATIEDKNQTVAKNVSVRPAAAQQFLTNQQSYQNPAITNSSVKVPLIDPYAQLGIAVETGDRKKTIKAKKDPYGDLGVTSTKSKITEADGAITIESAYIAKPSHVKELHRHTHKNRDSMRKFAKVKAIDPYTELGHTLP